MANPIVTITMESGDMIKVELYPDIAPNTVNNFISLVKKEYEGNILFPEYENDFVTYDEVDYEEFTVKYMRRK